MKISEEIKLNKFIANVSVFYDDNDNCYKDAKFKKIENINAYIGKCFQNVFSRNVKPEELAYITRFLKLPYDFENVAYKTYLKELVDLQSPKVINDLKANYDFYLESIQDRAGSKQCIYISGESGTGKTTYAKILASKYYSEDEIFISSGGSHPFDEYYGQKCIIIDDFRDSVLPYNDLLRLLDNNTSSNVGARYHNKSLARCELIILTSVKSPIELYKGIDEERFQLYRRINYFKLVRNEDKLNVLLMKTDKLKYIESGKIDITEQFNVYCGINVSDPIININQMFNLEQPKQEPEIVVINDEDLPF